jgi:hypothetical protein
MTSVFISYARANAEQALRLYGDLTRAGVNVWLDQEELLPGQHWKSAIENAIRDSRYFIALLSSESVNRRGYVQKELVIALDLLDEFPSADIFVIPARLDACSPRHPKLKDLQWVDLYHDWDHGVARILKTISKTSGAVGAFTASESLGVGSKGNTGAVTWPVTRPADSPRQHPVPGSGSFDTGSIPTSSSLTVGTLARATVRQSIMRAVRAIFLKPKAYHEIAADHGASYQALGASLFIAALFALGEYPASLETLALAFTAPLAIGLGVSVALYVGWWVFLNKAKFTSDFWVDEFVFRNETRLTTVFRCVAFSNLLVILVSPFLSVQGRLPNLGRALLLIVVVWYALATALAASASLHCRLRHGLGLAIVALPCGVLIAFIIASMLVGIAYAVSSFFLASG